MEKFSFIELLVLVEFLVSSILGLHLIISRRNLPGRLLGFYTLIIGITAAEPILIQVTPARSAMETIVAVCSFLLGPSLYLYTRYRLGKIRWRMYDFFHGLPALILLLLMLLTPAPEPAVGPETTPPDEVVLYGLFVLQLLGYTLPALFAAARKRLHTVTGMRQEMQHVFVMPLIIASLMLFLYSFITSLVPLGRPMLVATIQVLLGVVILVIALLNAEGLEQHQNRHSP
ncbi:MAG TPA: hypothetical protein VD816_03610 [Ohtaekwangia sp.]|nr:hypothetical protein [Ohtaekwangia sp.]